MSIRYKLLFFTVLMMLFALIGYGVMFFNIEKIKNLYTEETIAAVENNIAHYSAQLNDAFLSMDMAAMDLAGQGENLLALERAGAGIEPEMIQTMNHNFIKKHKNVSGGGLWYEPYVLYPQTQYFSVYNYWDGNHVATTTEYNTPEYDFHKQDWYTMAIPVSWNRSQNRDKELYRSAPYFDGSGNLVMVTTVALMRDPDGKLAGLSSADIYLDMFQKLTSTIKPTPSSFAFVVDCQSGLIIAHPDKKLVLTAASKLPGFKQASGLKPGQATHYNQTFSGREWTCFYRVADSNIGLAVAVPVSELMNDVNAVKQSTLWLSGLIGFSLLALTVLVIAMLNRIVVSPLNNLVLSADEIANGNLDVQLQTTSKDEIGKLSNALSNMIDSLKNMIRQAKEKTEEAEQQTRIAHEATSKAKEAQQQAQQAQKEGMLTAASQLEKNVSIVSSASEQLSNQINQSSRGAEQQAQRMGEAATAMDEMNSTVLEVARNASQAAENADNAKNEADSGKSVVAQLLKGIEEVHSQTESMKQRLAGLGERAENIGQIMNVITDIADQTNLLALNAAIEAARAGEAGRGFAVVADEVRKLAEKTMDATKEVEQAISGIQQETRDSINGMDSAGKAVEHTNELADKAGESLGSILGLVEETADQVRNIATASEEQSSTSEEIARTVGEVNTIATETSQAMQMAADAVANLARQAQELAGLVESLKS